MATASPENIILTDSVIAKEALRLLKNALVAAPTVHRGYEKVFTKVGSSISVELPYRVKSASGRTLVKQPLLDVTTTLNIDNQEHVGLEYTVKNKTLSIENFSERYLKSAMIQLANKVDASILATKIDCANTDGTPGTQPADFLDFAEFAAKQTVYGVPKDSMRNAVLDPFTCANLSDDVTRLFNEKEVMNAYREGYKGKVAGYNVFESNNLTTHTTGDFATGGLMNGTTAEGATSIVTDTWSANNTDMVKKGDVLTIAGVYGVNPQTYESTGILKEFVVTADTDTAAAAATIPISPAMNAGAGTVTDSNGDTVSNKAYQNISALPANGAAITLQGTANTTYKQDYIYHRDAIALVVANLELPQSATVKERVTDPDSGLSLLLTQDYDISAMTEVTRIDIVWGTKLIYPELATKIWSVVG